MQNIALRTLLMINKQGGHWEVNLDLMLQFIKGKVIV